MLPVSPPTTMQTNGTPGLYSVAYTPAVIPTAGPVIGVGRSHSMSVSNSGYSKGEPLSAISVRKEHSASSINNTTQGSGSGTTTPSVTSSSYSLAKHMSPPRSITARVFDSLSFLSTAASSAGTSKGDSRTVSPTKSVHGDGWGVRSTRVTPTKPRTSTGESLFETPPDGSPPASIPQAGFDQELPQSSAASTSSAASSSASVTAPVTAPQALTSLITPSTVPKLFEMLTSPFPSFHYRTSDTHLPVTRTMPLTGFRVWTQYGIGTLVDYRAKDDMVVVKVYPWGYDSLEGEQYSSYLSQAAMSQDRSIMTIYCPRLQVVQLTWAPSQNTLTSPTASRQSGQGNARKLSIYSGTLQHLQAEPQVTSQGTPTAAASATEVPAGETSAKRS